MNASEMRGYKRAKCECQRRICDLETTLGETVSAFALTLMVGAEKNGKADIEKRYRMAEQHPQIQKALRVLVRV